MDFYVCSVFCVTWAIISLLYSSVFFAVIYSLLAVLSFLYSFKTSSPD